jgi:hypothetical protein
MSLNEYLEFLSGVLNFLYSLDSSRLNTKFGRLRRSAFYTIYWLISGRQRLIKIKKRES